MKAAVAQRPPRTKTKHCGNSHRPSSEPQQHYTEAQLCEWRERVALALLSQKPPAELALPPRTRRRSLARRRL
jgi:hypothetical protein